VALKSGKILAPLTFQGSCNKSLFETWLKDCLLPKLERGDIIIIIDNASFHKGEYIREIIDLAGCEIWYLPPYLPDLNKIENWWAVLKTWMKQRIKEFESVRECVDAAFIVVSNKNETLSCTISANNLIKRCGRMRIHYSSL